MTTLFAFQHPFAPTVQPLSNSANLTDCLMCTHSHDEPELVAWPLSLESLQNLTGHMEHATFL